MSTTETICWFIAAALLTVLACLIRLLVSLHRLRKQIQQNKIEAQTLLDQAQRLKR